MDFDELEQGDTQEGAPLWVVTYGDMMSLLLVFFITMLSFSVIDEVKFRGFVGSIQEALGVQTVQLVFDNPSGDRLLRPGGLQEAFLRDLLSVINQSMAGAKASKQGEGLLMTVPGNIFFESGKADLKPAAHETLRMVGKLMRETPSVILQVEGHTDDVPINTPQFRSNWELSAARAIAVIRFLMEECQIPPQRLAAAGYADSHPLVPNDSDANRERNRRVEFRFMNRPDIGTVLRQN